MIVAYFSNYLNHHQIPFAEAMNAIDGVEYRFVAVSTVPEFRRELGYHQYDKPYLLSVKNNDENKEKAMRLAIEADVAIFVACNMEEFIIPRLRLGKLTFECSERWFKQRFKLNVLSPRLWRHQMMYHKYGRNSDLYMLCASAYAANDYYFLHSYRDRCFKWAYFTEVPKINIEQVLGAKRGKKIQIMWCSRFIDWKHPELAISVAKRLKEVGFSFDLNMYGNGPLLSRSRKMVEKSGLADVVHLRGNAHNEVIVEAMRENHIFLLTSDQNEGWGAVANEAMSNGCSLVGSDSVGSVPFLVDNGKNGLVFKSGNEDSLFAELSRLMNQPELCESLSRQAYNDMINIWSPQVAARRFLCLVEKVLSGSETPYKDGPCSKAIPIR